MKNLRAGQNGDKGIYEVYEVDIKIVQVRENNTFN